MECHFVAVISKKGLITFQHSSLKQPIAFQIFVTKWPITVKHSSQPLYHLFFTALYESTPCWLTESTLVNQQGWSSESLRLNDQQWWIIWSDSPTTETPGGSLKPKEDRQKRESNKKEEKTKNAEVGKSSPAKEMRKLKTMRNCWIDNISLAGRVCLYKQERENLQSLWDFIRLSLSIQQHSHASMFTIQCSEWNISVLYTVFIWNCKYHKTLF